LDDEQVVPVIKDMTKPKKLTAIFGELKEIYFPGWDKANEWHIRVSSGLRDIFASGECNCARKIIYLVPEGFRSVETLRATIIHEICHAIYPDRSHRSKLFQHKLLRAAEQAQQLGQQSLAEELNKHVEGCQLKPLNRISFQRVLLDFEEILKQDPPMSLDIIIEMIAEDWNREPDQLLKQYPDLKKTVRKMKRQFANKQCLGE